MIFFFKKYERATLHMQEFSNIYLSVLKQQVKRGKIENNKNNKSIFIITKQSIT
jgi:hypothetical protein